MAPIKRRSYINKKERFLVLNSNSKIEQKFKSNTDKFQFDHKQICNWVNEEEKNQK